jgi:hypothetical protein
VTSCSVVVGYQRFGGPRCLHLQGILSQHYTASQPRRPRFQSSPPWKTQFSDVVSELILSIPRTRLFVQGLGTLLLSINLRLTLQWKEMFLQTFSIPLIYFRRSDNENHVEVTKDTACKQRTNLPTETQYAKGEFLFCKNIKMGHK